MKRRDFLRATSGAAAAGLASAAAPVYADSPPAAAPRTPPPKPRRLQPVEPVALQAAGVPGPTASQRAWMDLKFGLFIHFGINTF